jgi:hypothetical protein
VIDSIASFSWPELVVQGRYVTHSEPMGREEGLLGILGRQTFFFICGVNPGALEGLRPFCGSDKGGPGACSPGGWLQRGDSEAW